MKIPVFTGSSVALVTPFLAGAIDYDRLEQLIDFQINAGTAAITICGTTGESATLSQAEHSELIRHTIQYVNGRVKVIAGTGTNNTQDTLQRSLEAADAGADGLLIVTPYYNKTTQLGLIQHYTYIADRVDTPILLYNVPSRTGVSFAAETYRTLAGHPNINGVKEASGNHALLTSAMAACGDALNFFCGNDGETVQMMALGAKGLISVAANLLPAEIAQLCRLCQMGSYAEAAALQLRYTELIQALFAEANPIPIKRAMQFVGLDCGDPRLPLCPMSAEKQPQLEAAMRHLNIL